MTSVPTPARLDFHNHLIPGVDDGAKTIEDSIAALNTMREQNILKVVATPHLRASLVRQMRGGNRYFEAVEEAWTQLVTAGANSGVAVYRGFEILLDMPSIDATNPLLRLAGSNFILVEFPFLSIPPHSDDALFSIKIQGFDPIVAHPERYRDLQENPAGARDWVRVGAYLQANAGSFIGQYGRAAERTVWTLLELGLLSYVCSDFHATGLCHTEPAYNAIEKRCGPDVPRLLFSENPLKILKNEPPARVQPPLTKGILGWLRSRLRR